MYKNPHSSLNMRCTSCYVLQAAKCSAETNKQKKRTTCLKQPCAAPLMKINTTNNHPIQPPYISHKSNSYCTYLSLRGKRETVGVTWSPTSTCVAPSITRAGATSSRWQEGTPSLLIWTSWRWTWLTWRIWEGSLRWCLHPEEPTGRGEHHTSLPLLRLLSPFLGARTPVSLLKSHVCKVSLDENLG